MKYEIKITFLHCGKTVFDQEVSVLILEYEPVENSPLISSITGYRGYYGEGVLTFFLNARLHNMVWEKKEKHTDDHINMCNMFDSSGPRIFQYEDVSSTKIGFIVDGTMDVSNPVPVKES